MSLERSSPTAYFKKDAATQPSSNSKYKSLLKYIEEESVEQVGYALLSEESKPQLSHDQLMSLLRNAVSKGNLEIVQFLLSRNLNLRRAPFRPKLLSPLWIAIFNEQYEIAQVLIERGAPVNVRLGRHPTHDHRSTMLHIAAYLAGASNDHRLVDLLVKSGANVNARDASGCSVLHYVTTMGDADLLEKLLNCGVKLVDEDEALVLQAAAFRSNAEELLRLLAHHGANVRIKDSNGCNLLHTLAKGSSSSVGAAKFLIERGVSLGADDELLQRTPLHFAVDKDKYDMVKLLLDHGADVNAAAAGGKTPLQCAAKYDRPSILRLLLDRGADIHKTTSNGRTALHGSCVSLLPNNVQVLLDFGGNLNVKDYAGNTPLALIEFKNTNPTMVVMLKRLARLTFDGSFVDPSNLRTIDDYPKLKKFYTSCLKELGRMKNELFFNSLSLHSILSKSLYSLTLLTINADFVRAFESHNLTAFPLYASNLDSTLSRAKEKREALCSTEDFLSLIFSDSLPHIVIRKVAFFIIFD